MAEHQVVFRIFAFGYATNSDKDECLKRPRLMHPSKLRDEMRLRSKVKLGRAHGGCLGVERR